MCPFEKITKMCFMISIIPVGLLKLKSVRQFKHTTKASHFQVNTMNIPWYNLSHHKVITFARALHGCSGTHFRNLYLYPLLYGVFFFIKSVVFLTLLYMCNIAIITDSICFYVHVVSFLRHYFVWLTYGRLVKFYFLPVVYQFQYS
jgi:hypothetical protein